jgi:aspartate aminotransferase
MTSATRYAADRLSAVLPSASAGVSQLAGQLRAAGRDIIDLGLGEPDFDTPAHIIEAAHQAALAGKTRYPPTDGSGELKEAIAAKLKRDNALDYAPNEIIVANGAKQVIFDAVMASLEPGQEVLLCAPHFDSYRNIVLVLGGVPKVLPCPAANGFRLQPEDLAAAITPNTRWLFLNSPSNPAGATYSADQLRALGEVIEQHPQLLVLSDEIYEHIIFDGQLHQSFTAACPQLRDQTICVNGVSKAYAMTGWRIGYGAAPQPLITAMTKVQSQISSGACSIAQAAATAALNGPQDEVTRFCAAFERRRNLVVEKVAGIPRLTLDPPGGAFYALLGCEQLLGKKTTDGVTLDDDVALTRYLLEDAGVAAVAGSVYGLAPFVRLSTAASEQMLAAALDRIATSVDKLSD